MSLLRSRLSEATAIVLSILLAFGIDAWWQDQVEHREELRLVGALLSEFRTNQDRLAEILAFHSDLRETALVLLSAAASPESELTAEAADTLLGDVTWWGGFNSFESATLDAVVLGGKLDLIQNADLQRGLTAWRREVEAAARVGAQEYSHFTEVWLPLLRANSYLPQISNTTTTIPGSGEPNYGSRVPASPDRVDHRVLLRNREFQNALLQKLWIEDDVLHQYRLLEPRLMELIDLLQRELEN